MSRDLARAPRGTYHVIDDLVDFAYGEFQYQVDRLVVVVAALYVRHCILSLNAVTARLDAAVSGDCVFFFDYAQTYNFVAVVDELVDEPLKCIHRVLVLVETA